jgi:hypothetical protein
MSGPGPVIAIVGSNRLRTDSGEYRDDPEANAFAEHVNDACKDLGRALSEASCRLLVYSADSKFIEAAVVSGYCAASSDKAANTVLFRHPAAYTQLFAEQTDAATEKMFDPQLDQEPGWEASFYRSLQESDGVILVGGAASTLIAGHVALVLEKAVIPVTCFRGAAGDLHNHVAQAPHPPTKDELQATLAWSSKSAQTIVASLKRRCAERQRLKEAEELRIQSLEQQVKWFTEQNSLARLQKQAAALLAFLALPPVALGIVLYLVRGYALAVLLFVALLASVGVFGGATQLLRAPSALNVTRAIGLGGVAGALFGFLYLLPQLAGTASATLLPTNALQFALTLIFAMGAGMTADAILDTFQKRYAERAPVLVDGALNSTLPGSGTPAKA